ncbi:MAG: chorismate synthase, partial [Acidimicrobiales bacterium]
MSSSFGTIFRITTFGESHGGAVGVVVDGCPPRLSLDAAAIQAALDRRRPGQSRLTTQRNEPDEVEIVSGLFDGRTLGTPIALIVRNKDARPGAYDDMADVFRPSHADFTTEAKYGIRSTHGGGRASARETVGRVAAGAVARAMLEQLSEIQIVSWVDQIHGLNADVDEAIVTAEMVEAHETRCPDAAI